jgi:hypothetical protein
MLLHRAIRRDGDGLPWLSDQFAKGLGVRPGHDITPDEDGLVYPETGGASVCPDIEAIPFFLRDMPVWQIESDDLPDYLAYRDDPDREGHGFLEPGYVMELGDYQDAVAETRELWVVVQ